MNQYKLVAGAASDVEQELNQLAADGWEPVLMTAQDEGVVIMLRRKPGGYPAASGFARR